MAYSVSALTTLNLYMKRFNPRVKPQLLVVATVLLLAACGQRGPLYLPGPEHVPVRISKAEANEAEVNEAEANKTEANESEANETGNGREKTSGT